MAAARQTTSFDRALRAWLASMSSPNTRAAYGRDLEVFVAWTSTAGVKPLTATSVHIEAFRVHCETEGASVATVHRRMSALSSFYRHATAGSPNPVDGAARPTAALPGAAVLAPAEAARVWVAACRLGPKSAALIGLVLLDGLKTSELLPLDVDDVRFASGATFVGIERGDQPGVDVMVDRRTGGALRRYVGRRVDGPLFVGDNPTREPARLTRFGVDYLVKRAGAAAGLDTPLTVNALRRRQVDGDRGPRSTR